MNSHEVFIHIHQGCYLHPMKDIVLTDIGAYKLRLPAPFAKSQTGCVTVPGREAPFLVARQRFPYRSRFNFSVKNMEHMLLCNAICDQMHIDFSRKIYCGANDASIGVLIEVH